MEESQNKFSILELRKKYPNIGKRWSKEEDEKLKKLYEERRQSGFGDFEAFVAELITQLGRAAGGIKSRLAMHFSDVPGWDYGRDELHKQELDKQALAAIPAEKDVALRAEYQKYSESKQETYAAFLKRMSELLAGAEGRLISHRLMQLVGNLNKYGKDDLTAVGSDTYNRRRKEPEIPRYDFSANPDAMEALRIMEETNQNLFLTGEAGTGKSSLLQYFRYATKKNVAVLAPTGVAALNVEGQTIHSFCAFGPDITLHKVKKLKPGSPKIQLLQKINTIIIDEISMVRADLLDCVDKYLRLNGPAGQEPFGGVQMIFIGDLYQLPPVEKDFQAGDKGLIKEYQSPYFFEARAFKQAKFRHIRLKQAYRQQDRVFLDVLNAVRNNAATQEHLSILNQRSQVAGAKFTFEKFSIYLTPTNARARQVNNFFLERINSELKTYEGEAAGKFEDRELPTDLRLQFKTGSQVMMLNNDRRKRWVNGTMGKITGVETFNDKNNKNDVTGEPHYIADDDGSQNGDFDILDFRAARQGRDSVIIELETGETVYVQPHTWEMYQYVLDKHTQKIDSKTVGTFTQYPFKLAWAVTIHKAQGKTFDKVYIDLSTGTFAHGQLYVALSRCRTLGGLFLKRPVVPQDIRLDSRIVEFLDSLAGDVSLGLSYTPVTE